MYPAPKSTLRDVHWGANWSGCTAARIWRVGELSSPAAFEGPPATVTCVGGRPKGRPMQPETSGASATRPHGTIDGGDGQDLAPASTARRGRASSKQGTFGGSRSSFECDARSTTEAYTTQHET
jgi:hypothetical protein